MIQSTVCSVPLKVIGPDFNKSAYCLTFLEPHQLDSGLLCHLTFQYCHNKLHHNQGCIFRRICQQLPMFLQRVPKLGHWVTQAPYPKSMAYKDKCNGINYPMVYLPHLWKYFQHPLLYLISPQPALALIYTRSQTQQDILPQYNLIM